MEEKNLKQLTEEIRSKAIELEKLKQELLRFEAEKSMDQREIEQKRRLMKSHLEHNVGHYIAIQKSNRDCNIDYGKIIKVAVCDGDEYFIVCDNMIFVTKTEDNRVHITVPCPEDDMFNSIITMEELVGCEEYAFFDNREKVIEAITKKYLEQESKSNLV